MNQLKALNDYGQSVWLDYIRRGLITSGELKRMIEEDGLRGVTSNPSIFQKAITGSTDYREPLEAMRHQRITDAKSVYERLAVDDIRDAADVLMPVYEETNKRDGYVSLEVSPHLAHDTAQTVREARRLWKMVDRRNLMVKVPATQQGLPAIKQLIGEGINVNVTLIFDRDMYVKVAEAYMEGLEDFASSGGDVSRLGSVASFFVSRIDSAIDSVVAARLAKGTGTGERQLLKSLLGSVAVANARLAYKKYKDIYGSRRWQKLALKGAQTQRVLWASTSTKNPNYPELLYVEELIGPDTVNTMPPSTFEAFRDHGRLRSSLEEGLEAAVETMQALKELGISMKSLTDGLLTDGVRLFAESFDNLLIAIETRCRDIDATEVNRLSFSLPEKLAAGVSDALDDWESGKKVRRLWARDSSLWTGGDERDWLGWLDVTEDQEAHSRHLIDIAGEMKGGEFSHAVLLGMGGSSLCPDVLGRTFGRIDGFPELHVLDSTDPDQIRSTEERIDLARTLFIVSSKSGTTLEPNILKDYFFERVGQILGSEAAGSRFIAITDPGSKLQQVAESDGFRHIYYGMPSIGGRYSALSDFGMVPAAIMGIDTRKFIDRAAEMVAACSSCVPVQQNPGVVLGTILGVHQRKGRDKLTVIVSPGLEGLGAWLEQLLAESTGKEAKAIIPVDREAPGAPDVYGDDRLFVYIRLESAPDEFQDRTVDVLESSGQPVVRINVKDINDLGQEFFRWEIATVVAGSIMGINPFDQPDVEASKVAAREFMDEFETRGYMPPETAIIEQNGIKLFTDDRNAVALKEAAGGDTSVSGYLRAHFNRLGRGDYFALLAFIEMNESNEGRLQRIRLAVRDRKRVASCLGFGPRFLHSTGQAYKGGPNTGLFLQITSDAANDIPVPGKRYSFGVVKAAQQRGDFQILSERGRRALRVHLSADTGKDLATLEEAVMRSLA
ncbi:MAG: bifunctional transaldolase/phosoglucose isomerase [Candidatus Glassbacteria bacterium]